MTSYELMANDGYCTECGAYVHNEEQCPSCGAVVDYNDDIDAECALLNTPESDFSTLEDVYHALIAEKDQGISSRVDEFKKRNSTWWSTYAGTVEFEMEAGDYRRYCD